MLCKIINEIANVPNKEILILATIISGELKKANMGINFV